MEEIKALRTPIETTTGINPDWIHGEEGSSTAHNEILKLIDSSSNFEEFNAKLLQWADQ